VTETLFHSSALTLAAAAAAPRLRQQGHREKRLPWVKAVVLQAAGAPRCDGKVRANFAIVRTITLQRWRQHGFVSITQG
jgi:hypothetical protein